MASAKVTVKAGKNGPVFLPVKLDGLATIGNEPVEVEDTRFIRGRVAAGDLVVVTAVAAPAARASSAKKEE